MVVQASQLPVVGSIHETSFCFSFLKVIDGLGLLAFHLLTWNSAAICMTEQLY